MTTARGMKHARDRRVAGHGEVDVARSRSEIASESAWRGDAELIERPQGRSNDLPNGPPSQQVGVVSHPKEHVGESRARLCRGQ